MIQDKIDEIFSDMPNVFCITDDILVMGYDEDRADHDAAVHKVLRWCKEVNLKLNKDKCHFWCTSITFFGKVISREGVQPYPQKIKVLMDMLAPKSKKELQAFLSIFNYLGKLLPRYCRGMWSSVQADIQQGDMEMECIIPGADWQG